MQTEAARESADVMPRQVIDTGHTDMIHDAQWDYYGTRLATCSSDGSVRVFEVDAAGKRQLEAVLQGHDGPVWQLSWSHPKFGGLLASCGFDHRVIVWRRAQKNVWNKMYEYVQHKASVNSVAFAPLEFGLAFACASSDGFVSVCAMNKEGQWSEQRLVDAQSGSEVTHNVGATSVSWAPAMGGGGGLWSEDRRGGRDGAAAPVRRLVSGGCDNLVKVWRYDDASAQWQRDGAPLEHHTDWVRGVAWAPSVGLATNNIASCGQDKRVVLWSKDDASDAGWAAQELPAFSAPVWSVSWSLTGNVLGVASGNDKVTLWKEELDGTWKNVVNVGEGGATGGAAVSTAGATAAAQ